MDEQEYKIRVGEEDIIYVLSDTGVEKGEVRLGDPKWFWASRRSGGAQKFSVFADAIDWVWKARS